MRRLLAVLLICAVPLAAQEETDFRRLELRVISSPTPGTVTVDRGSADRIEIGDPVELMPRGGQRLRGTVVRLEERSAMVELEDRAAAPAPGTRAEVRIPRARTTPAPTPRPTPPPVTQPDPSRPPDQREAPPPHPPWPNQDPGFTPDRPLLARVGAVRPSQRARLLTGRAYVIGQLTKHPESDYDESLLRTGADVRLRNPLGDGGDMRFSGEYNYRHEYDGAGGSNIALRDLSYRRGGDRFAPMLWQFGRFLQDGMPEFGMLDGVEWNMRRASGDVFGASVGFMPEPDDNVESWADAQVGLYYLWEADPSGKLSLGAGFQKTAHEGSADRDLVVLKGHYAPASGWRYDAALWIDYYTSGDTHSGGIDLTQAFASLTKDFTGGNRVVLGWRRSSYPDIQRKDYIWPTIGTVIDHRSDRLALDVFSPWSRDTELHGHTSVWNDEDHNGGAVELGLDTRDLIGVDTRTDLSVFGNAGDSATVFGGMIEWQKDVVGGRWDALYEISHAHDYGFTNDVADLLQHRLRLTRDFFTSGGIEIAVHAEAFVYGEDLAWSLGCQLQRRF